MHASEESAAKAYDQGAIALLVRQQSPGTCSLHVQHEGFTAQPTSQVASAFRTILVPCLLLSFHNLQGTAAQTNFPLDSYDVPALVRQPAGLSCCAAACDTHPPPSMGHALPCL